MAEGRGWKLWGLPRLTLGYVLVVDAVTVGAVGWAVTHPGATPRQWLICVLLAVSALVHLRLSSSVERVRRQDRSGPYLDLYGIWTLSGGLLLPLLPVTVLIVVIYGYRWWHAGRFDSGRPAHRAFFSASTVLLGSYAVAAVAAVSGLRDRLSGLESLGAVDALLIAAAIFAAWFVNTVLVAAAILMTTRLEKPWPAFGSRSDSLIEVGQLALGVFVALSVVRWPGFALLMVVPVVALHRTLLLQQLEQAARTDDKTGLLKASAWRQHAQLELNRARQRPGSLAVFMIDLDRFSEVNNRYGHLAGDVVLQRVANVLTTSIRRDDVVGRYGGEEFAVLMPSVDRDEAVAVAERIRCRIHDLAVAAGGETITGLTVSVGVALHPHIAAETVDTLLAAADEALYEAKRGGRDQVRLAGACQDPEQPRPAEPADPTGRGVDGRRPGYTEGVSEPLDLGATELPPDEEARARREHDLDRPEEFDRRNGVEGRAETRAVLLPEESGSGSADPEAQAREVLRDSDLRTELAESAPDTFLERRQSGE